MLPEMDHKRPQHEASGQTSGLEELLHCSIT
uniref:Uncharacterized protein n=1 Tax=Physcomitrium patens TaxID=3218 RepID=A0A7I4FSB2_PHYPA